MDYKVTLRREECTELGWTSGLYQIANNSVLSIYLS